MSTSRRFISQLGERERINEIFLVGDKQLRPNRNGNLYLQMTLSDRTGAVTGMMWNAGTPIYESFDNGDFVHVEGTSQFYNGKLQILVSDVRKADSREAEPEDFFRLSQATIDELVLELGRLLRGLTHEPLLNLAECFLSDQALMELFARAPAGMKHHHAYPGGLLEHVVSLMQLARRVAEHYDELNADLLLMGCFLHDVGKVRELTFERDYGYSDEGQLVGHLVIGVALLDEKIRQSEELSGQAFPPAVANQLRHMILSHNGSYEFGSPKLPMTLEALTLHLLDTLDAKLHAFGQIMDEDLNADSNWTSYQPAIGRKLYRGGTEG